MAYSDYGVRWQVNFVARGEVGYKIEILQAGWSDTPIVLRGAENPIETSESNDSDAFLPIRKQTGTLRIADNGFDTYGNAFDYTDMIPSDTYDFQIRLWQLGSGGGADTLRWVGYMRPDSLTSRMYEKVSIREFPLVCPLGAMYDKPFTMTNNETNKNTVKTIGRILHNALNSTNIDWQYVYKQNNVDGRGDLIAKISLMNFLSENMPAHDSNGNATWTDNSTSYGSILEDICKFFGWVLYSRGLDIYIVARQHTAYFARFDFDDLMLENDTSLTDLNNTYIDLEDDLQYASVNHSTMRMPGYRNISVEANVNQKQSVIDPDLNKITDYVWWSTDDRHIIHQDNDYQYVLKRLGTSTQNKVYLDNYEIYENRILYPGGSMSVPFVTVIYDNWKNEDYLNKTEFSFKYGVCAWNGGVTNSVKTFWLKTLEDVIIPKNAAICIQASATRSYDPQVDEDEGHQDLTGKWINASLKVGDKYYNPSTGTWTSTETQFSLVIRSDGSITAPQNVLPAVGQQESGILWDNHYGSSGFCAYSASEGLCGRMTLALYSNVNGSPTNYDMYMVLDGLRVNVITEDNKSNPQNSDKHQYEDIASPNFSQNLSVSLNIASGIRNKYGIGQILTNSLQLLSALPFRNGSTDQYISTQPEQNLLTMLKRRYSNVTTINTIEVLDNVQACIPSVIYSGSESDYGMLSVSHKWADGTMEITMINQ